MDRINQLKLAALILPGLTIAILLLFAVGETAGGDWSGLGHVAQAIPIALLMWLGWKRPAWGGLFLCVLAFVALHTFSDALRGPEWLPPFLIFVAPLLLSGLMFLGAGWLERGTA